MPRTHWLLYLLGLVSVHVILDLYGVGHECVDVAHDGVGLGRYLPSGGRKIVPPLFDYSVALDVHQHAVMLEYAVVLPGVLQVDLSLVHAVTSYTGVCAVVINRVILRCFSAGTAKNQKWGNYKHGEK